MALAALNEIEQVAKRRRVGPVDVIHREQQRHPLAQVDGQPVEILPAYLLFRAVEVPAGAHRVTFHYRPRPVRLGFALSALGLLGALASAVVGRFLPAGGRGNR